MKIGVFSDIHDNIDKLLKSFWIFKKEQVKEVFFGGDLCSPFTIDYFKKLKIPVRAVFGNNEGDKISIIERIEKNQIGFEYPPKQGLMWDLKILGKRIGIYHGFQKEILESLIDSQNFDIFLSGHNHLSQIKKVKKTLWLNPGSICGWAGLDIDPIKPSVAILDIKTCQANIINF